VADAERSRWLRVLRNKRHNAKRKLTSPIRPVSLPAETFGKCRQALCGIIGHLGDGLCAKHYDHSLGS